MKTLSAKMKICGLTLIKLLIVLALLGGIHQAAAQGTRFFRISGPTATKIIALRADGTLVWSNAQPSATYTVQTVATLTEGTNWVNYVQLPVTQAVNTNQIIAFNPPTGMVLIPAGTFTIGDTLDGEGDAIPANVMVSAFYMDVNLVNYSLWQSVYNWATSHGYYFSDSGYGKGTNYPVTVVDWYDCVKWCNARSQQAGLAPVYYTDGAFTEIYTNGDNNTIVYPNWAANGYRLPTEAEWEKAARGGLSGQRFPWGNTISWSQANYYSIWESGVPEYSYDVNPTSGYDPIYTNAVNNNSSPVGSFPANGYGLYDMAGNVFEWCWDLYVPEPYQTGSPYLGGTDPRGPAGGAGRVMRGGSYVEFAYEARCAERENYNSSINPSNAWNTYGFRCVRGP